MNSWRLIGVEDLECLVDVCFRVRLDLLAGKLRTGRVAPGRVADERRTVSDDECDLVAKVLELAELAQRDGVADMDVGSRRIDTELDVEGFAALELLEQSAFRHDLRRARGDDVKLFFRCEHRNVLHTTDLHKRFYHIGRISPESIEGAAQLANERSRLPGTFPERGFLAQTLR